MKFLCFIGFHKYEPRGHQFVRWSFDGPEVDSVEWVECARCKKEWK